MAGVGALVDLSLFATSPSDSRQFATSHISPTLRGPPDVSCYSAQRQLNFGQERNFTMKSLPPLPRKRLCQRRPHTRRSETESHCILDRLKRGRVHCACCGQRPTLQQRRNNSTVPALTLSIPTPSHEGQGPRRERAPRPTMIWMPDEQMWLVPEYAHFYSSSRVRSSIPPPNRAGYRYTRSEPSSEPSALFDLPPLSPTHQEPSSYEEPPDEIRNQFLRLMRPDEDERLSSLFQEAIQSVPPMTDSSPPTPHPAYAIDEPWMYQHPQHHDEDSGTETSAYDSYHTAHASPGEDRRSIRSQVSRETPSVYPRHDSGGIYSQISRENPWDHAGDYGFTAHSLEGEPRSVVSQLTQENSWADDHRSGFSPLSNESPWTAVARPLTRSRSTTT